jgi:hypothetical protein
MLNEGGIVQNSREAQIIVHTLWQDAGVPS